MIELLHLDFYKTEFRKCNVPHGTDQRRTRLRVPRGTGELRIKNSEFRGI